MSTIVALEILEGLDDVETACLRQLLYDAFGEFISVRSSMGGDPRSDDDPYTIESAISYVRKRYPDLGVVARQKKAEEVFARKRLAQKLRRAASNVSAVNLQATPLDEMIASLETKPAAVDVPTELSQEFVDAISSEE